MCRLQTLVTDLRAGLAKAHEVGAYELLRQPRVVANALRHAQELRARATRVRSQPVSVELELTNRCNLACIQCLRSRGMKPYARGDVSRADYGRILAQFPLATSVTLNGFGEPLLHPELLAIVADTRAARPWAKIVIYTNGMLLRPELSQALVGSGLSEVLVSIDAASPETYEKVRRGGELATVHANLRALVAARAAARARLPRIGVNFVMLNENEGELVRFVEQARELGVDFVNCITYATYDWGFVNRRSPESYRAELAAARAKLDALGLRCRAFPSDDLGWAEPGRSFDCDFFWGGSLRVTYTGDLALGCCTPFREQYSYGNLLETPFAELWNGDELVKNRTLTRLHRPPNEVCRACLDNGSRFFAAAEPALVKLRSKG